MCEPSGSYKDPVKGAIRETISAISALNMEPEPLKDPEGDYLSERDHWAKHAKVHLHKIYELLQVIEGQSQQD